MRAITICRKARHSHRLIGFLALYLSVSISWASAPQTLHIEGLQQPVEIIRDASGIAHIYAQNQHDLFFAQGYNAARDRLFQFELWRRKALGTLAEIQGAKALAHDRSARLLRFRGDIQKEMAHYHSDGVEIITAFVAGVNAYIKLTEAEPERLPFEFGLLGITPGYWTPEVVVSRHNALTGGLASEVMLAKAVTALGADTVKKLFPAERELYLQPFDGVDLSLIGDTILEAYSASRQTPAFTPSDLLGTATAEQAQAITEVLSKPHAEAHTETLTGIQQALGSNNWLLSGDKTASGMPLLANDPHRRIQTPALRYWVHLNAPGWNVIGGGEPVLPGVSIGHNEHGAWGLTIFAIDQEDLFVYHTKPGQPDLYRYQGEWKAMVTETTEIAVKGQGLVTETLKYTEQGPVLYEDPERHLAYALKAAWLEQGAAPYLASLRMDQAKTWAEFREACTYSGLPGENMIWADKQGNIAWQAVGLTPLRIGWTGTLPVPGNGDYQWQGYVPIKAMPHRLNPPQGWYGTANHNNVPAGYPNIFSDWYSDPARAQRIAEVLSASSQHRIRDSMALQYDTKSMSAAQLVPLIVDLRHPRRLRAAIKTLSQWDYHLDSDSAAAAIYSEWERAVLAELKTLILPPEKRAAMAQIDKTKMLAWLLEPPGFVFGKHPSRRRDQLIKTSLASAVQTLSTTLGPNPADWRYGQLHYSQVSHPFSPLLPEHQQARLNTPRLPRGGGSNTVNLNYSDKDGRQRVGAGFRMIVDTSDWDLSVGTLATGQSGDPRSPHYQDLYSGWHQGEYFPVYFSRDKIEAAAKQRVVLSPP